MTAMTLFGAGQSDVTPVLPTGLDDLLRRPLPNIDLITCKSVECRLARPAYFETSGRLIGLARRELALLPRRDQVLEWQRMADRIVPAGETQTRETLATYIGAWRRPRDLDPTAFANALVAALLRKRVPVMAIDRACASLLEGQDFLPSIREFLAATDVAMAKRKAALRRLAGIERRRADLERFIAEATREVARLERLRSRSA